ncbi:MAG: hypothetical protein DSZ23_05670 [Thermodesulfatator sp.]|nr:MAG: hypothetical protein DSZ23_05670 [Thermodesulfatator sp.]
MAGKSFISQNNRPAFIKYGVVIIVLILWYSFLWSPVNEKISERQAALETQALKISNLQKRLSRLKGVEKRLSIEQASFEKFKKRLVPGNNPQMVSTNIQNSFLKDASEAGMEVLVYRSGNKRRWRDYMLAVSVFNIKGSTAQFVDLLEKVESGYKLLRLNNISISKIRAKTPLLRINLEVEALFMGDKAEI